MPALAEIQNKMHVFRLLLFLTIITSCQNSGRVRIPKTEEKQVNNEFHAFLKEGMYKVEYYSSKEVTPEQKKLLQKLSSLIETNTKTQKFFNELSKGEKTKYASDIGISRKEYNSLIDLFSYKPSEKSNGTLAIVRDENNFSFNGDGRLSLLDSVTVKLSGMNAFFKQYSMSRIIDSVDLSNEEIPQGDTLDGFEFYSGPDGILGLTGLDGVYELLIGKLKPSGRTYLSFFARQPDNVEHPIPEYITVIFD